MSIQLATDVRNARADAIATTIGASAKLAMYTGSVPANCAADTSGTKLVEYDLAASWMGSASSGAVMLNSLPLSVTAAAAGTAGYFRLFTNAQSTAPGASTPCEMQGTVTATGGGGDLTLDNTSIASGQTVNITGFTLTDGNS